MKFNFATALFFTLITLTPFSHAGSLLEMSELGGKCIETDGSLICGEGEPALHIINGTQSPDKAEFALVGARQSAKIGPLQSSTSYVYQMAKPSNP